MSGLTSLITSTGGNVTGNVTLTSTQPAILTVSNTPSAPYTINFSPVSAVVNTLNGKIGDLTLGSEDGLLSVTTSPTSGAIDITAQNASANTSGVVGQDVAGGLNWSLGNVYPVGALVVSDNATWVNTVAQTVPTQPPAPPVWAELGGGGVRSLNTLSGDVSLQTDFGYGTLALPTWTPWAPTTGNTPGNGVAVVQNLTGNPPMVWQGSSPLLSTVAYTPGQIVYSDDPPNGTGVFMATVTIPIGSPTPQRDTNALWTSLGANPTGTAINNVGTTATVVPSTSSFNVTTAGHAGLSNKITLNTILPTTNPPAKAGEVRLVSDDTFLGSIVMRPEPDAVTGFDIDLTSANAFNISVNNTARIGGNTTITPLDDTFNISITTPTNYGTGYAQLYCGAWLNTQGYYVGSVASYNGTHWLCILTKLPPSAGTNPTPDTDGTHWSAYFV